ncbi:HipA family kinase [Actinosynnema sp. ALI-1.44]|uniref:HipA family kinase n=1 Tax=Actinosynnema sp. ALI-1.44 TaxID=1933779 RepID=UPI001EDACDF9|nr:HipA family kinase [Actinosynnema sp. ALI-1.44]
MDLRTVEATRYVTPLREGGSLPGLIEADDLGMYVLKFRGAGHGLKALAAELIVGELARRLGFRVPDTVFVRLDPALARSEPDQEVQELLATSGGLNLGFDYLPGSFDFNPVVRDPGPELAARLVWFDALTLNVDRSWRNPNLLLWHKNVWLIDHGAALYFHHNFRPGWRPASTYRFDVDDHVMLPAAGPITAETVPTGVLEEVLALVPDDWLTSDGVFGPDQARAAYLAFFESRLANSDQWVQELEAARVARV